MINKFQSLRWQIQLWHLLLLVTIVGGMLTAFYFYEKRVQVELLDKRLWKPVHAVLPVFRMSPETSLLVRQDEPWFDGGERSERRPHQRPSHASEDRFSHRRPPPHMRGHGVRPPRSERHGSSDRSSASGFESTQDSPMDKQSMGGSYGPPVHRSDLSPETDSSAVNMDRIRESRALSRMENEGFYVEAWLEDELVYRSSHAPEREYVASDHERGGPHEAVVARWNGDHRELVQPTPFGKVIVGVSGNVIEAEMTTFRNRLIMAGSGVVLLGFVGGAVMTRKAMKPIQQMESTAQLISQGEYEQRIDLGKTQNELSGLAGVLNDSFEKIEQSFAQQVRFTADASHEMRTPLAVILAKAELALARERSPEKYQEAIQACYDSAAHMQGLIESLLDLSKVDSGRFSITRKLTDVDRLVQRCVDLLEPLAEQENIRVHCELAQVEGMVDTSRMKQVIINLMSNAIKYNVENGRIELQLTATDSDWELRVIDSGKGIAAEHLQHLFDRFYRIEAARSSKEGSTGLGLAITKAIVEAHGGEISASSVVGMGSTFKIRVPFA